LGIVLCGGEAVRSQVFLSGMNSSERVTRMWKMVEEVVIQDLIDPMRMLKKCGICFILIDV
jgi:hypothetical protein